MYITVQMIAKFGFGEGCIWPWRGFNRGPSGTLCKKYGMRESQPARRYRFGVFEADTATGELRRQGLRVRLHAQPFQVLVLLLDQPGELLTREELSRELWPGGTFVDYEHGLNSAVNRIREALGDTASSPRFIETLARRGYRFVAPVERIAGNEEPPANEASAQAAVAQSSTAGEADSRPRRGILASEEELPKTPYAVVRTLFVLLQLMYVGFYVGALANLGEIADLLSGLPRATAIFTVLVVTAAILIPVRAFVLSAVLLRAPVARKQFFRLWPFLLLVDELWSLAPFLLLHHINFGLALACTTLLVYSPFAQRSLMLMGAGGRGEAPSAAG
jgi:DNA-binding winged helix-turn-helix (wHTH) protein